MDLQDNIRPLMEYELDWSQERILLGLAEAL